MNELAAKKIKMMKGSVRCLVFGLVSFLPGIGSALFCPRQRWSLPEASAGMKKSFGMRPGIIG